MEFSEILPEEQGCTTNDQDPSAVSEKVESEKEIRHTWPKSPWEESVCCHEFSSTSKNIVVEATQVSPELQLQQFNSYLLQEEIEAYMKMSKQLRFLISL